MDFSPHPAHAKPPITLERQLMAAVEMDAVFCVACGQPDTEDLHDPKRCEGMGGTNDTVTVERALHLYDASCAEEPDLEDEARALHCIMVALGGLREDEEVAGG